MQTATTTMPLATMVQTREDCSTFFHWKTEELKLNEGSWFCQKWSLEKLLPLPSYSHKLTNYCGSLRHIHLVLGTGSGIHELERTCRDVRTRATLYSGCAIKINWFVKQISILNECKCREMKIISCLRKAGSFTLPTFTGKWHCSN